jgi:hypothetical protein
VWLSSVRCRGQPPSSPRSAAQYELSPDKTLITHARPRAARFLGYEITVQHSSTKVTNGRRSVNGVIRLRVPIPVINAYCSRGSVMN